jgi:hypothetical protein
MARWQMASNLARQTHPVSTWPTYLLPSDSICEKKEHWCTRKQTQQQSEQELIRAVWHSNASYTKLHSQCTRHASNGTITQILGAHPRCNQCMHFGHTPQCGTCSIADSPLSQCHRIHRDHCTRAHTFEGSIHRALTLLPRLAILIRRWIWAPNSRRRLLIVRDMRRACEHSQTSQRRI